MFWFKTSVFVATYTAGDVLTAHRSVPVFVIGSHRDVNISGFAESLFANISS